ncbi:MAG: ATP-binding protein [Terrimicrobiaceae bacterium]|nr:ATP-binding protein [Terrimicrobiaceae bacterium]
MMNSFDAIGPAADRVVDFLAKAPDGAEAEYLARLALEELVTNIVKYGHEDKANHEIQVAADVCNGEFALCISDDGHEFDPTAATDPDTTLPAEERPIGGLGLFLVRNMADAMEYRREDGRNVVTVRKKLG